MKRPNCAGTLAKKDFHGLELDECPTCHGIWFDADELNQARDAAEPSLSWMDFELWTDDEAMHFIWGDFNCPKCEKRMAAMQYADTGVTVDICPDHQGVWLDSGEFEGILAALEEEATSKSLDDYYHATLHEGNELVTGKEGFAAEWKDFTHVMRMLQYRFLAENPKFARNFTAFQVANPLK
jgi:Zn-finger nucleic acid-binding protein